jgi:hypothetical protein
MPIHPEGFASRHGVPAPAATFHPLPIFAANTARAPRSSAMTISAPAFTVRDLVQGVGNLGFHALTERGPAERVQFAHCAILSAGRCGVDADTRMRPALGSSVR